jgi:hypothetical protein
MIKVPSHDDAIRVSFTGTFPHTHGRAKRYGASLLYFTPDGYAHGFMVSPDELEYESMGRVVPAHEVENLVHDALTEYRRMFAHA